MTFKRNGKEILSGSSKVGYTFYCQAIVDHGGFNWFFDLSEGIYKRNDDETITLELSDLQRIPDAIEVLYQTKLDEINTACREAIEAGFDFANPYDSKSYHVTMKENPDQTNLTAAYVLMAGDTTRIQYWYSSDNIKFFMDATGLFNFATIAETRKGTMLDQAAAYENALKTAYDVGDAFAMEAIIWNVGV